MMLLRKQQPMQNVLFVDIDKRVVFYLNWMVVSEGV